MIYSSPDFILSFLQNTRYCVNKLEFQRVKLKTFIQTRKFIGVFLSFIYVF